MSCQSLLGPQTHQHLFSNHLCVLADPEDTLSGPYITTKYDPELITKFVNYLRPENMIALVTGRKFKGETSLVEKWYGTEYNNNPIEPALIEHWLNIALPSADLHLPENNDLIATDFELRKGSDKKEDPKQPKLLVSNELARLWFKTDDKFHRPKLNVVTTLQTPLVYDSPDGLVLGQIYVQCLDDLINEFSYMASMAGLQSSITGSRTGIEISVSGFNDKLHVLMEKIVKAIVNFRDSITEAVFDRIKEHILKTFKNFYFNQCYSHAINATDLILGPSKFPHDERIEAIQSVTYEDLKDFSCKVLRRSFVEMLVHGNASEDEAKRFLDVVLGQIKFSRLFASSRTENRVAELSPTTEYVCTFKEYNPEEENSCIQCIFQLGDSSVETSSKTTLLAHLLSEPCFNILRTKEALGYIVYSSKKMMGHIDSIQIIIQGGKLFFCSADDGGMKDELAAVMCCGSTCASTVANSCVPGMPPPLRRHQHSRAPPLSSRGLPMFISRNA